MFWAWNGANAVPWQFGSDQATAQAETTIRSVEILHGGRVFETVRDHRVLVTDSSLGFCLLGRDPLFKRFDVTFSEKRKKLTLERV